MPASVNKSTKFSVAELKSELGKRHMSTRGNKDELNTRLTNAIETTIEIEAARDGKKRQKRMCEVLAAEYICPITQELPVEPVTAEDGKIYEKAAIQKWLTMNLRSPATGLPMGTHLLPATQVRNTIEQLVLSGDVDKDKTLNWLQKFKNDKKMKKLRARADQGDLDAVYKIGIAFSKGMYGVAIDKHEARIWFEFGAMRNDVKCMAMFGDFLLRGIAGSVDHCSALIYISQAAALGSDMAAWILGNIYIHNYPIIRPMIDMNVDRAQHWFEQVCVCEVKHLKHDIVLECKRQVSEHRGDDVSPIERSSQFEQAEQLDDVVQAQ